MILRTALSVFIVTLAACSPAAPPAATTTTIPVELEPIQGEEAALLTDAPEVPPAITRTHATKVVVKLEVKEVVQRLADGVDFTFWTFGGKVPGKFIRVREGDLVELHL